MPRPPEKLYDTLAYIAKTTHTTRFMLSRFLGVSVQRISAIVNRLKDEKWTEEINIGTLKIIVITKTGYDFIQTVRPDSYPKYITRSRVLNQSLAHNLLVQYCVSQLGSNDTIRNLYFDKPVGEDHDLTLHRPDAQIYFNDAQPAFIDVEFSRGKANDRIYRRFYDCFSIADKEDGIALIVFADRQIMSRYSRHYNQPSWPLYEWTSKTRGLIQSGAIHADEQIRKRVRLMHITDIDNKNENHQRIK